MKKIVYLLPLVLMFVFSGCSKKAAEKMECESQNIGYVTMTNTSKHPYNVFMDGKFQFIMNGNTFRDDVKIKVGQHHFEADQISGYILVPTIRKTTIWVWQCDKTSWVFP